MFNSITLFLSLLYVNQIGGGFLRFKDPNHMTAPLDLEDLDPGSYDELMKYNPSVAAPLEVIWYGGHPGKPFDWSAPEIEDQKVQLITEPYESMYKDGKEEMAKENRDEIAKIRKRDETDTIVEKKRDRTDIFAGINRAEKAKLTKRDDTRIVAEKNRDDNDTVVNEIGEKVAENPSFLKFLSKWPKWIGNKTPTNGTRPQEIKSEEGRRQKIFNTSYGRSFDYFPSYYNRNILRNHVRPKDRSYSIETPEYTDNRNYELKGSYVGSCYRCGELNYGKWWRPSVEKRERNAKVIPEGKVCFEAFEGDGWSFKTKARLLRSRCYNNEKQNWKFEIGDDNYNYYHECVSPPVESWLVNHTHDRGNPVECFGRYTGKCFKRFLDVGSMYTERGCASWPPHQSNSIASHRFTKLEYLLHKKDDACVSSPVASLTPFARGISLYVRYHVCVCTGKWCNTARDVAAAPLLLLTTCIIAKFSS